MSAASACATPSASATATPTPSTSTTNTSTPKRPSSANYSDRFIPSRAGSGDFRQAFDLLGTEHHTSPAAAAASASAANAATSLNAQSSNVSSYDALLRAELLDARALPMTNLNGKLDTATYGYGTASEKGATSPANKQYSHRYTHADLSSRPTSGTGSVFRFHNNVQRPHSAPFGNPVAAALASNIGFGVSADRVLSASNLQLAVDEAKVFRNPARTPRKVGRVAFKVLDAPCLRDDFYLSLVDWSAANVLAVGLENCVYLWSAHTSSVTKLCELKFGGPVCSVSWSQNGERLAVGTSAGLVQVWDVASSKLVRTLTGHTARVGCLSWSSSLLSTGGRDFDILNRDMRAREPFVSRWAAHRHEVCGLKWSPDDARLASGGNDNRLLVWSAAGGRGAQSGIAAAATDAYPVNTYDAHEAAVKAIAWSPHQRGLLASGGGTQDKRIRFWNVLTDTPLASVDTGSQVCNLAWSKNVNELVSTHGYSQNQIVVWKYPTLSKVATLTGHALRVLYLAVSPSGETIVTGAGDETLRFWNVFPKARGKNCDDALLSRLSPARMNIR